MEEKRCLQCKKPLPSNFSKYCSYNCRYAFQKAQREILNPTTLKGTTAGTTGAIGELRVAVDLMSKSYDVFRALSPSSPCDLAILKDNKLLRIEVRTAQISSSGKFNHNIGNNYKYVDHYAWVLPDKIIYEPELQ